jgi:hypothetical protein
MDPRRHCDLLAPELERLAAAVEAADPDSDAAVPGCPDWVVADLANWPTAARGGVRVFRRAGSYTRSEMRSANRPEPDVVADSNTPPVAHPGTGGATMGPDTPSLLVASPPASHRSA